MIDIKGFLDSYEDRVYDIRQTRYIRIADQKCTPDIISFIADCILNTEYASIPFSKTDIWKTQYFKDYTRIVYGKPYSDNKNAFKEYDKIAGQPLTLLACSNILKREYKLYKKHWCYVYTINNQKILEYISQKPINTCIFLQVYFTKVVECSGMSLWFEEYKKECKSNKNSAHVALYNRFKELADSVVKKRSLKKKEGESDRILHKILNIFAFFEQFPGSNNKVPTLSDLMYNKQNRRDKRKSDKALTRKEAEKLQNEKCYINYTVEKAKKFVHKMQGTLSEVKDELATGEATNVHHIFPQSKFPSIAFYYENLILLTASQHYQKAHPNNNTQLISTEYQYICLMAKSQTIENYIKNNGEDFYTKENFVKVINVGLENINSSYLADDCGFDDIRSYLTYEYLHKTG